MEQNIKIENNSVVTTQTTTQDLSAFVAQKKQQVKMLTNQAEQINTRLEKVLAELEALTIEDLEAKKQMVNDLGEQEPEETPLQFETVPEKEETPEPEVSVPTTSTTSTESVLDTSTSTQDTSTSTPTFTPTSTHHTFSYSCWSP